MQRSDDHRVHDGHSPSPDGQDAQPGKRPYETPRLICYGHVKTLTAGTKAGLNDISLNSSIV